MWATSRALLSFLGVWSLAAMPLLAQHYNVPFHPRSTACTPACAGSPNLSTVLIAWGWGNATCGSITRTYTPTAAAGDYASTLTALSYTNNASDTYECGLLNTQVDTIPCTSCSLDCVWPVAAAGAVEYFSTTSTNFSTPGDDGQLTIRLIHDGGTDQGWGTTFPIFAGLGTGNNRLQIYSQDDDDVGARACGNDGVCVSATTQSDTTSTCCNGGTGPCANLFADGDTNDNVWTTVGAAYDATANTVSIIIDGCTVATTTSALDVFVWHATTEAFYAGDFSANDTGDWRVGYVVLGNDPATDFHTLLSGGDDTFTDGNECWCGNVGGGTDCAG